VLVVDHEPLIRWSLAETLTEAGHTVVLAADRMAALEAVAAGPPFDVVLLDGDLPGSCDLSLLSGLKALAPSARVILMTAFGSRALERSALSHGASLVLGKPFDMEDLPALVA
jgi:DNA-binding NtrC family response regulator